MLLQDVVSGRDKLTSKGVLVPDVVDSWYYYVIIPSLAWFASLIFSCGIRVGMGSNEKHDWQIKDNS